ncbi:hypothetical protein GW7_16639 [Heterocephalus glaber]|uniref:Uncharacterized protein n=1 Tax=Heterocephalus glaber TaxID=10181 RepID=G5B789_HETGA|nr:hypothetical protein GW7_16639 [Heterocephalus glaber]
MPKRGPEEAGNDTEGNRGTLGVSSNSSDFGEATYLSRGSVSRRVAQGPRSICVSLDLDSNKGYACCAQAATMNVHFVTACADATNAKRGQREQR